MGFYLDDNGVTIKCTPDTLYGATGEVNGVTYTAVDKETLRSIITNGGDTSAVCTSLITDMYQLVAYVSEDMSNPDARSWDTSNVTNMNQMFWGATLFNQNVGYWDVSNVLDFGDMFSGATSFNQDIGSWDVSSAENMSYMFRNAQSFNQDIGGWDVSSVTRMDGVFHDAVSFNQDIGSWDVSKVYTMVSMFYYATAFNQDIGGWNVNRVLDMRYMFYSASLFNQDLTRWCVYGIKSLPDFFASSSNLSHSHYPLWGDISTCPDETLFTLEDWNGSINLYRSTQDPNNYYIELIDPDNLYGDNSNLYLSVYSGGSKKATTSVFAAKNKGNLDSSYPLYMKHFSGSLATVKLPSPDGFIGGVDVIEVPATLVDPIEYNCRVINANGISGSYEGSNIAAPKIRQSNDLNSLIHWSLTPIGNVYVAKPSSSSIMSILEDSGYRNISSINMSLSGGANVDSYAKFSSGFTIKDDYVWRVEDAGGVLVDYWYSVVNVSPTMTLNITFNGLHGTQTIVNNQSHSIVYDIPKHESIVGVKFRTIDSIHSAISAIYPFTVNKIYIGNLDTTIVCEEEIEGGTTSTVTLSGGAFNYSPASVNYNSLPISAGSELPDPEDLDDGVPFGLTHEQEIDGETYPPGTYKVYEGEWYQETGLLQGRTFPQGDIRDGQILRLRHEVTLEDGRIIIPGLYYYGGEEWVDLAAETASGRITALEDKVREAIINETMTIEEANSALEEARGAVNPFTA